MVGGLGRATLVVQCGAAGSVVLAEVQPGVAGDVGGLLTGLGLAPASFWAVVGRIQEAARACRLDALAALAGEITYSFGGGDD